MNRLANKRALITGGTGGIGFATASHFLQEGARVAITGHDANALQSAKSKLGNVVTIHADAGNAAEQKRVASAVSDAFEALDILFVNAGVADFRPLDKWDEAGFDRSVAINLKGPFFLVQALLPVLANPAAIVFNTSINAHIGMPASSVYSATKAGLLSLVRTLSGELLARGIRVNAVSPGPISTSLHHKIGLDEKGILDLVAQIPAARRGSPDEIANAVVFLVSDEAAFTVGSELIIDGGMTTL